MELDLYSINNLRTMEVIDISLGTKLGYIKDIKIDCDENKIISLILPGEGSSWFGKMDMLEIFWDEVYKIGVDVILVNCKEKNTSDV